MIDVHEKNARWEMRTGRRLGTEGTKTELGFDMALNGKEFLDSGIDFTKYDAVLFNEFKDDYRDSKRNKADLHDLVASFKIQIGYYLEEVKADTNDFLKVEINQKSSIVVEKAKIDTKSLRTFMAGLRQIKTPEEMKLLTKAIRIAAQGQIEDMKAMHSGMSETELQGLHAFVQKK